MQLGPKGLDKLLVDNQGGIMVTNDESLYWNSKVEYCAKMIISASETQEKSVSDGTTSTVILCAKLLRNAWYLVSQGSCHLWYREDIPWPRIMPWVNCIH